MKSYEEHLYLRLKLIEVAIDRRITMVDLKKLMKKASNASIDSLKAMIKAIEEKLCL